MDVDPTGGRDLEPQPYSNEFQRVACTSRGPAPAMAIQKAWLERVTGRHRNITFSLDYHLTNIPNISFWNADSDEVGVMLASTDIQGRVVLWDVWQSEPIFESRIPIKSGRELV